MHISVTRRDTCLERAPAIRAITSVPHTLQRHNSPCQYDETESMKFPGNAAAALTLSQHSIAPHSVCSPRTNTCSAERESLKIKCNLITDAG
jgi:hypothetical protein